MLDPKLLISALHPSGSIFSVCAFGDSNSIWFDFAESPDQGIALATATDTLARHHGVYHCVPNLVARPAKGRGTEKDALNAMAAWADIDASSFEPIASQIKVQRERGVKLSEAKEQVWRSASDADRQAAKDAARVAISKLPVGPPSAMVDSGRGWHPYWLFTEAATNLDLLRAINRKIAKLCHGDKCWDLARVLKVPGTHNRKNPDAPVMAELCLFNDALCHNLEDLARKLGIPAGGDPDDLPPAPVEDSLPDGDERIARARAWVAKVPGAVSGDRGHDRTFAVAQAVVRGFAVDVHDARAILAEYNSRCVPPWPEKDVEHKLADAATKSRLPLGYLLKQNGKAEADPELARARARFSSQAIDDMTSVESIYDPEALADLAALKRDDPGFFAATKAALAGKFTKTFRARDFDRAIDSVARQREAPDSDGVDLAALFPGSPIPPGLSVPSGWVIDARGIWKVLPDDGSGCERMAKICNAPVAIVGRSVDLWTGREVTDLSWPRDGSWQKVSIPRSDIADRREIVSLSGLGFPVHSGNALDIVSYLSALESANIDRLPLARTSSSLGWVRDRDGASVGFLAGRVLVKTRDDAPDVKFLGADAGDDQIADAVRPRGTFESWKIAARIASAYPKVIVGIYASLAPPLLAALGAPNFCIDWSSPTSTGKTTALKLAASCWGSPDERSGGLVRGWDSTRTFVERVAAVMNHMPTFLDDSARARSLEEVSRSIYDAASGVGRGRGSVKGIQKSGTFHTIVFSTGEQKLALLSNDSGTKARVVSLWGSPFGGTGPDEAAAVAAILSGISAHHGHAGPEFARWLVGKRDSVEDWRCERNEWIARYASSSPSSIAGRMAENLATLHVVMRLAHEALALPWPLDDAIMAPIWEAALEGSEEADVAKSALDYAISWAQSRKSTFWTLGMGSGAESPHGGWSGRWNEGVDGYVGFFPNVLGQVLEQGGYPYHATVRTWLDRGWLETNECSAKLVTLRAKVADEVARLVAVKFSSFKLSE